MALRSALIALAVVAFGPASPAGADAAVGQQAFAQTSVVPTFVPEAGRLYVAADLGQESARSFVQVAGAEGPLTLTLFEAASGSTLVDTPALAACALTNEIAPGAVPPADCSAPTALVRGASGDWSVTLDPWPGFGVAIVPVLTGTTTFHLALDPAKTAVATVNPAVTGPADVAAPVDTPLVVAESLPTSSEAPALVFPEGPTPSAPAPSLPTVARRVAAAIAVPIVSAAVPSPAVVLPLAALLALFAVFALSRRPNSPPSVRYSGTRVASSLGPVGVGALALILLPLLMGEASVYKFGLVLIVLTGAIGLHLLVNWAGELSLAHATLVGLPAFTVAKLSADHGLSPIVLLPVALLVGLVTGAVVGIPAIRARGLQVALVTLAAGVAIDRFFFTRSWVVGPPGGSQVDTPTLGPLTFTTARALYPVLALMVMIAIGAAWMIHRSRLGRGLLWVKAHPDAAASFGIPVARYRALAYALAGGFAGFAGGLTAMWVQRLTPEAFPLSRSFTYLIIVALAGRGFVGGVAAAAGVIEGGRLFLASSDALITYGGPIGLIITLTQHRAGLNGLGRTLADRVRRARRELPLMTKIRPLVAAGAVAIAVGFAAIGLAWYHAGNTSQVWVQNQELISGGIGGLALVIVGVTLIAFDRVSALVTALQASRRDEPRARPLRARREAA